MTELSVFNDQESLEKAILEIENPIFLCDENTVLHCFQKLNLKNKNRLIVIGAGEKNKSPFTLNCCWNELFKLEADRHTTLINLGGGVVSDLGGLAASTYNRGIPFVNVPTTLMGMVDASHGGKTGINFQGYKNYIGTFSQPQKILVFPGFLNSLAPEHILSGFAEMVKHGLIADKNYFETLTAVNLKTKGFINDWPSLIRQSCAIKTGITGVDFKEKGLRKILNYGHTIGHALESYFSDEDYPHGYFVAAGMICESLISHKLGNLDEPSLKWIIQTIDAYFSRIYFKPSQIKDIASRALRDKKNKAQIVNCVWLEQIGQATYDHEVSVPDLQESLLFYHQNGPVF